MRVLRGARGLVIPLVLLLVAAGGCVGPTRLPPPTFITPPDPSSVESVLYLIGDAGEARLETSPILSRLQRDVEDWAGRLESDSSVVVLFLGDNVYPLGMHAVGTPEFSGDSAVVMGQVSAVSGPQALASGARGYFLAGNHDWGLETQWPGFDRLVNLSNLLSRLRTSTGAAVRLAPEAGSGGPFVLDLGDHVRLLLLDTAWWILDGGQLGLEDRDGVLAAMDEAMGGAGDRDVIIAAHHPFRSAGPHGGEVSFWRTLGIRYLLTRSGALLQDLTSVPYRELEDGLRDIFERQGAPLAFVGGHEHTLQVFEAIEPEDPLFSLVSGAASKSSAVSNQPGLLFARSEPGYMRIEIQRDGGVTLFVEAAPARFLSCTGTDQERLQCLEEGVAAFRTVYSARLKP